MELSASTLTSPSGDPHPSPEQGAAQEKGLTMDPEVLLKALAVEQELWPLRVAVELCQKSTAEKLRHPAQSCSPSVLLQFYPR